jgi:hypothetical protein
MNKLQLYYKEEGTPRKLATAISETVISLS